MLILPLSVFLFSLIALKVADWGINQNGQRYWHSLWNVQRFLACITLYASGNYLVIREIGASRFGKEQVPFTLVFYAFTLVMPWVYILGGMLRKDRILLHTGLICCAFSIFTYKYYHHPIPLEVGLVVGGLVLLALSWFLLRWFQTPRLGITSDPVLDRNKQNRLNLESMLLATSLSTPQAAGQKPEECQGGGGNFGGGGASGKF